MPAIDARFDRMIEQGAIEEVRALLALGLDPGLPAMRAHGVRELAAYLAGDSSLEEAVEKSKTESRRYAKRQMTWLRRFMQDWEWFPDAAARPSARALNRDLRADLDHAVGGQLEIARRVVGVPREE